MLIDANERFRFKSAGDGGAKKLYLEYLAIAKDNDFFPCAKSIPYLKAFVQYPPSTCQWVIREENGCYFTLLPWGGEYLYLISAIAAYYLDIGGKNEGLQWAVKAIHLFDYFAPTIKRSVREKLLFEMAASGMACSYPVDLMRLNPELFLLDWEVGHYYSEHRNYANDN